MLFSKDHLTGARAMAISTLTTDMGLKDHYVAVVKGSILGLFPQAVIVDVSHQITPFDNAQAAFVLRNAYPAFPKGTVHLIGVNPGADAQTPHLVVMHDGHWFVGADNGIFSLLFDGKPQTLHALRMVSEPGDAAFPVKGVLARAACHLAQGGAVEAIAEPTVNFRQQLGFIPAMDHESIRGVVVHVDTYGNVVTNIHRDQFVALVKDHPFRITFGRSQYDIAVLNQTYDEGPQGERVALFGASGMLEIAVNKGVEGSGGGASRLFGLHVQDPVRVELRGQRALAS